MPEGAHDFRRKPNAKFGDPFVTATGEMRASVSLVRLETLWFNTGSLCNIACAHCYMESSPTKDDLAYLRSRDVRNFLDEIERDDLATQEIGFTGGEPFMNPDIMIMLDEVLARGYQVLVLTNAMKPLWQCRIALAGLQARHGTERLTLRVSIDHFTQALHEEERGPNTWAPMQAGVQWLIDQGFRITVAGRTLWNEDPTQSRQGYQDLFATWGLNIDAHDPAQLVLFPEMDDTQEVPEITTACWNILDVRPDAQMCARSRMVVLRKGDQEPTVTPCTLLPYDECFDLGKNLKDAKRTVQLNHPHCAKFCVLGGASCSS